MKKFGFGGESSIYVFIAAVAIFCIILGFSFGATWRSSVSETAPFGWTEFWLNRYQTGLTILAAIFIAKQQIDVGRKQHVAQIKRSFRDTLTAIEKVRRYASYFIRFDLDDCILEGENEQLNGPVFRYISRDDIEFLSKHLDSSYSTDIKFVKSMLDHIDRSYQEHEPLHELRDRYSSVVDRCKSLLVRLNEDEKEIANWS